MKYYKIVFSGIPHIVFAHCYSTEEYKIDFNINPSLFEITYIENGEIEKKHATKRKQIIPPHCINVTANIEACHYESSAPIHKHFTIGIGGEYTICEIEAKDIIRYYKESFLGNDNVSLMAIIPEITIDDKYVDMIEMLIKKTILNHSSSKYHKNLSCLSYVFNILSVLTDHSAEQVLTQGKLNVSFGDVAYCKKAITYITKNINEKISLQEVANNLKISAGHLSRIFKSVTGLSVIEYVNRIKINFVKELIHAKNINLSAAGRQAGIHDEKYLCRLFKKHTGMTMSEYKKIAGASPF